MGIFTIFSKTTRLPLRTIAKPNAEGAPELRSADEVFFEGFFSSKEYFLDNDDKVSLKPESRITLTGAKLEDLPNPTTVTITGNGARFRETIEDGKFEFSVDVPGEYIVKCEAKVELPIEFKVVIK